MALKLYNTLTRQKETFVPLDPSNVRMYVCGPTVYDFAHIGNARPAIVFDVLFRLLRHLAEKGEWDGGKGETEVKYVRNITDVDDKINKRAAEDYPDLPLNEAIRKVTETTLQQYRDDVDALGCLRPTVEPRATEHIGEMKALIEKLVEAGHAYVAEDHVLFDVPSMPGYGNLSRRSLDEMQAGARVDVAPYKKDAMDFVLWKPSKPGEPAWDSPAGIAAPGRPGWHIECSAMSWKHLGETFDIHGGGIDLVFPHHENERAQTCCAFHEDRMAQVWMHNGFLQVEGEKMSKSLGNFVTIRELLDSPRLAIPNPSEEQIRRNRARNGVRVRLAMLMTHYRSPIDWTNRKQIEASTKLADWLRAARGFAPDRLMFPERVVEALKDDLNTHLAIKEIDEIASVANSSSPTFEARQEVAGAMHLLGFESALGGMADDGKLKQSIERAYDDIVTSRIAARNAARAEKNWAEADRIRDELAEMGIALKDTKNPETGELDTTWEPAR